jgi:hypothetical protein
LLWLLCLEYTPEKKFSTELVDGTAVMAIAIAQTKSKVFGPGVDSIVSDRKC